MLWIWGVMQVCFKLKVLSELIIFGQKTRPTSSEVSRISDFTGLSATYGANAAKDSFSKGSLSRGKIFETLLATRSKESFEGYSVERGSSH